MKPACQFCASPLQLTFADLGMSPLSNSYVPEPNRNAPESTYPLHARVCGKCFLVQLEQYESRESIFSDYLYFSSYSDSWLKHAERYAAAAVERFGLGADSLVVEIASNDGYLLQYFGQRGIPVLGVEPAANVAQIARDRGIRTDTSFFGASTAERLRSSGVHADLIAANNVLAHVPDINDFVAGFKVLLKPEGVITFEFPSLERLIAERQFDTIYHEHFSYLSLLFVEQLLAKHDLRAFDVQPLVTHGGSLRVFACHVGAAHSMANGLVRQRGVEAEASLQKLSTYEAFSSHVVEVKCGVLEFFISAHRAGKTVAGYGAPAKGNTLLNYCGIGPEFLPFTVDRSPHKQGHLLPGSRIPVLSPDAVHQWQPDFLFILPWNLRDEIAEQMADVRSWGGRFVTPIPRIDVF